MSPENGVRRPLRMLGFSMELAGAVSQLLLPSDYKNRRWKGLIDRSSHGRPSGCPRAHRDSTWVLLSFTSLARKRSVCRSSPPQPDFRPKLHELTVKRPQWSPFKSIGQVTDAQKRFWSDDSGPARLASLVTQRTRLI